MGGGLGMRLLHCMWRMFTSNVSLILAIPIFLFTKQKMYVEVLSQWERLPPPPFHTLTHSPSHSSPHLSPKVRHITTDEIMVLKINKRMNGVRKRNEVELLKKLSHPNILQWVADLLTLTLHAHRTIQPNLIPRSHGLGMRLNYNTTIYYYTCTQYFTIK